MRATRLIWCYAVCAAAWAQVGTAPPALTVAGPGGTRAVTAAELAAMPHTHVTVENGHTHASESYTGVPLLALLTSVGAPAGKDVHGKALSDYIVATGADGYKAVLSLAEAEPDFHPGEVLVADSMDGKPLADGQGPMKLVVSEDRRPARCVHSLVRLELRAAD